MFFSYFFALVVSTVLVNRCFCFSRKQGAQMPVMAPNVIGEFETRSFPGYKPAGPY